MTDYVRKVRHFGIMTVSQKKELLPSDDELLDRVVKEASAKGYLALKSEISIDFHKQGKERKFYKTASIYAMYVGKKKCMDKELVEKYRNEANKTKAYTWSSSTLKLLK